MNPTISFIVITFIAFAIPIGLLKMGKQYLTALVPIYLIVGNTFALSFFKMFGIFQTSLAVPIYCAIFLVTDILSEFFSKEDARRAVLVGFLGQAFFVVVMFAITKTSLGETSELYKSVFNTLPRLVIGSFIAYLVSQFFDVYLYHELKNKYRPLWIRNNIATMSAQLIDTTVLMYIAFYGIEPFTNHLALWNFILTTWVIKLLVSLFDTPFLYLAKKLYTRKQYDKA